ncbi:unnamed protein product [Penicillium glandicola]
MGWEAECSYPSVALPVTENKSAENRITKKTGALFSGPMFNNVSTLPKTGDKRPRDADIYFERTEFVDGVVGSTIQSDSSHAQKMQITPQHPEKRQKISEPGPGSAARQSALGQGQTTPFGTGMPSRNRPGHPPCSISPILCEDEMELRCNLTTEINVQRMKYRNLPAGPLRNIVKLLMKAKSERPTPEPSIAGSSPMPLNDEWREEDDLMETATSKLEKGGRCSRALLSRFENFLYGPLMSPEEKKMQERTICVEECLSSASAPPTSNHHDLFLGRLRRIISHPDAYGLDEKDSRIGFLRNELLATISTNSTLSRPNRRKFAELLDPDGDISNSHIDSPGVKAETPTSTRKVPPRPSSPRVPSSPTPETPPRTTTTRQQNPVTSLSPSSTHPPPFPPLSPSTTHPVLVPSRSSSLFTTPLESIDPTDDTMSSSFPFIRKRTPKKRVASGNQLSQPNDPVSSPFMQPASKKRPALDSHSGDIIAPAPKRAASGTQPSNFNNIIGPAPKRAASGTQPFSLDAQRKLWNIFVREQAHGLPILNLDKLKVAFALAVNHGKVGPTVIDPTFGLCIAIACHLTGDKELWEGRKWYDAALSNMADPFKSRPSLQSFHHQILQIHYLHLVGHLRMAWDILSLAIGRAQSLRMQTMHGGCLAVDEYSLQQVRLVWQCLWTKKLSLTLQFGVVDQSLDSFYESPMPMQSHITENMGASGVQTTEHSHATSSFFIACASLLKYTDDLITVENDLRVTRMECPIKWLSIVDLRGFQELNEKLSSWNDGLPKFLEWKGPGIDFTMEEDSIIRRMCVLTHVRFLYFRLRQYRPFFILSLRLSQPCACETSPHLTGKDIDSVDASPVLGLVYYSAVKCLAAAQGIVKTLCASFADAENEDAKCEKLEYLYAAALILIAARSVPLIINGGLRGLSAAAITTKSLTTLTDQLKQTDVLLRQYQEGCKQAPKLLQRIEHSRAVIDLIKLQSSSSHGLVADSDVRFEPIVWQRIYHRLGLDLPFQRFPGRSDPARSGVVGRRLTFGWIESLPVDMDSDV